jgi:hypothetical protein
MVTARRMDEWDRTAMLASLLANPYRDTNARPEPYSYTFFHPYRETEVVQPDVDPYDPKVLEAMQGRIT